MFIEENLENMEKRKEGGNYLNPTTYGYQC